MFSLYTLKTSGCILSNDGFKCKVLLKEQFLYWSEIGFFIKRKRTFFKVMPDRLTNNWQPVSGWTIMSIKATLRSKVSTNSRPSKHFIAIFVHVREKNASKIHPLLNFFSSLSSQQYLRQEIDFILSFSFQ